jgi:hypothetical protein
MILARLEVLLCIWQSSLQGMIILYPSFDFVFDGICDIWKLTFLLYLLGGVAWQIK